MARRSNTIADSLKSLGFDPVANLARIAELAERSNNLPLAARVNADLLEYVAPKLKMVEHEIGDNMAELLMTPEQRRARIRELTEQVGVFPVGNVIDIKPEPAGVPAIQQEHSNGHDTR